MDKFLSEYLLAALWTATDSEGNPLDTEYRISDFSKEAIEQAESDIKEFKQRVNRILAYDAPKLLEEWVSIQDDAKTAHDLNDTTELKHILVIR